MCYYRLCNFTYCTWCTILVFITTRLSKKVVDEKVVDEMRVNEMEVDETGVDEMGVDEMGRHPNVH